jgi:hypothetical protein
MGVSVAVLNIGSVNNEADEQPARVGVDVPLAAFDVFPGVKAPYSAAFRRFDALILSLPKDDCRSRPQTGWLPPRSFARRHHQSVVHRLPKPAAAPLIEVVLNRGEGR